MRSLALVALAAGLALSLGGAASTATVARDYAEVALNVLPPGQSGSLTFGRNASDQLTLYDGLTPLGANVAPRSLRRYFKSARFGLEGKKPVRTDRPRAGVRILWDRWGVPHVYGTRRADVHFGAGWVTAKDRGLLLHLLRWAGRIAALDVPGVNPFAVALSGRRFTPSPQAEAILRQQERLVAGHGRQARQLLRDVDAFVAGINAYNRSIGLSGDSWRRVDVIAVAALMGANLGLGGGDETRRSLFLDALEQQLGPTRARAVWSDLREKQDPETPVSIARRFAYGGESGIGTGSVVLDDGSFVPSGGASAQAATSAWPAKASNALLLSAKRSTSGRPLFVAGPQVGHAYPQLLMELDLHGGGIHARGASFPGLSLYVLLGRGSDYAWSATSSNSDVVDHFVEELCGDDSHYRFRGSCREMGTVDAGTLQQGPGQPDRRLIYRTTVHGPVLGYATVDGRRVAISSRRSSRGRELLSALMFQELNTGAVRSSKTFLRAAAKLEFTFNVLYADNRDIAMFSTGRLPVRAPGADGSLPTVGTGEYEWRGFAPARSHPQVVNPPSGAILQWNNKPAAGFAASDDNWSFGSVHRVDLLRPGIAARRRHSLATVVGVMNRAATQDLRVVRVWPVIADVLRGSQPPSARAAAMAEALSSWQLAGSSRLDRDLDGSVDHPGAAIMDAAWRRLADAVMAPVVGSLTERLGTLQAWSDNASGDGSAYGFGWFGWIDKDLRTLLGRPVRGPYATRFCGGGDLAACRASLWAALEAAGADLAATKGPDPQSWRADANRERINYSPLPRTMRWANRPTFQQVMSFKGHRPR
ncbi:MAG TPA: penicillin acylase family protein [Gaiellaceae bacterium]|nr:penicillin acylase family protein [Gaiellaceae bacterium]